MQNATAARYFTVGNDLVNSPAKLFMDNPNSVSVPFSGVASSMGWAVGMQSPILKVALSIDGSEPQAATYGLTRPDVCASFLTAADCPAATVGWIYALATTLLANGKHTITVSATSSDGRHRTDSATFTVAN